MQFLAGKGFQAIVADAKGTSIIEEYYSQVEAEKIQTEFWEWDNEQHLA